MSQRIRNFNPGPAALPLAALEKARDELLDFRNTGMSVLEVSHRSKEFDAVMEETVGRVKRLLGLDDNFQVLFLQGGASFQFCMIPMNLSLPDRPVAYVDTGTWSTKAIKEARIQGKDVKVAASSEDRNYAYIPKDLSVPSDAAYLHLTSNNTIKGTQWAKFPETDGAPLVCDMSSDIFSRAFDPAPFGLIYAGAQKNAGPSGVTLAILRKDMLERVPDHLPTMLKYSTFVEKNSLFNTPPTFGIYMVGLVLEWLEESVGGLDKMEALNNRKAELLYGYLDGQDFFRGTADADSRSKMNVTFRLPSEDLEKRFVAEALAQGLGGLKGHRSVGGCRASIYNAVSLEAVEALVTFMKKFAAKS